MKEQPDNSIRGVFSQPEGSDLHFTCMADDAGFMCGVCGNGFLGIEPEPGRKCEECGAKVAHVLRGPAVPFNRPFNI